MWIISRRSTTSFGHDGGDQALIQLARIGQSVLRDSDVLARQGGDEFAVLMPETDLAAATDAAERLRQAVAEAELSAGSARFGLTISIGLTAIEGTEEISLNQLLKQADQALYEAKQSGRNKGLFIPGLKTVNLNGLL